MIKSIVIEGFKSLEKVKLQLGNLNLFIGTNASGKSNFLDALRVLQGIGYGFRIDEILDGKPKSANSDVWDGIRGGSKFAAFKRDGDATAEIKFEVGFGEQGQHYSISMAMPDCRITDEQFFIVRETSRQQIFHAKPAGERARKKGAKWEIAFQFEEAVDTLIVKGEGAGLASVVQSLWLLLDVSMISKPPQVHLKALTDILSNALQLDVQLPNLRDYAKIFSVGRIGERGENFAGLVKKLLSKPETADAYLSWLKELSPDAIDAVEILHGAVGEPMFAIKSGNTAQPAPLLSDGTLRFAALAAALLQPDMPQRLLLEEIETGIHPSRLRLLVELLENRSKDVQIFATTHSPYVLAWLDQSHYAHTFIFKRDEETGATKVVPLTEVPHLMELLEKKQPLSDLFAEGWLESVL